MPCFLGIDTSNYTSSAAIYDMNGIVQQKKLLPVPGGSVGLRQSDAVFAHVKQLGELLQAVMKEASEPVCAVGVSGSPREEKGSYMPCFLTGMLAAQAICAAMQIPCYTFSHQAGHIAAALYDTGSLAWLSTSFLAFHVSGGTTQCLLVRPGEELPFSIETVAASLDLHGGQVIDRVGAMLGLAFPAGPALEQLAQRSCRQFRPKIAMKGRNCCLSGVENQCRTMLEQGVEEADIAAFCLASVCEAVEKMTEAVCRDYPGLPLVYAGGVMANRMMRARLEARFGGRFASPAFSADNAAGVAVLCERQHKRRAALEHGEGGEKC